MTLRNLVGLVYNTQVPGATDVVRTLVESPELRDRCWTSSAADLGARHDSLERSSLVVTVGGDGTILRTALVVAPFAVPIVGINMGRVGFMTELKVEEAAERLPAYVDGQLRIEERMMLRASVAADGAAEPRLTLHGLNDAVVGQRRVSRLLDIEASVDGVPLATYRADAVIVSTATGSTGYALSAGGPIVYPEARLMMVHPVAAHTGLREGLILPEESVVELKATEGHRAMLSVDGFQNLALDADDKVTIEASPYVARFLRAKPASAFYADLTRHPRVQ